MEFMFNWILAKFLTLWKVIVLDIHKQLLFFLDLILVGLDRVGRCSNLAIIISRNGFMIVTEVICRETVRNLCTKSGKKTYLDLYYEKN